MSSEAAQKSSQCNSWAFKHPQVLQEAILANGALFATQGAPIEESAFLDWALTALPVYKHNKVPWEEFGRDANAIKNCRSFNPWSSHLSNEPVMIICGSSGVRRGRLVPEPSRIIIDPGSLFTNAYMVQFTDGTLVDGDSGSWVVSEADLDLLGQVVATDYLGAAYFIPASDILRDIVKRGVAEHATLPSASDIQHKMRAMQSGVKRNKDKGKQAAEDLSFSSSVLNIEIPDLSRRPVEHSVDSQTGEFQGTRIEYGVRGPHTLSINVSSIPLINMLDRFLEQGMENRWFEGYSMVPGDGLVEYRFAFDDSYDAPAALKVFRNMIEGSLKTGEEEREILRAITLALAYMFKKTESDRLYEHHRESSTF